MPSCLLSKHFSHSIISQLGACVSLESGPGWSPALELLLLSALVMVGTGTEHTYTYLAVFKSCLPPHEDV